MTARAVTHLVGLAVAMANYEPRRLLVVTGFPRSGTTLIETFLAKHGGILPIYNLGETSFREYEPYGSVHEYGGSLNCLTDMCGPGGYVSWADDDRGLSPCGRAISVRSSHNCSHALREPRLRVHFHATSCATLGSEPCPPLCTARLNCWSYIERAKHIKHRCAADGACGGSEFDDKWLPMAKHPALIVLVEELHSSCTRVGVEVTFLVAVRNPLNWGHGGDVDYSCTGDCRHEIVENWVRCVGRLKAALHLPNVMAVRYEDMGQEQTWRQIERLLGLDAIPITILPGKHVPGGRRELVEGESAVQESGEHRRLVIEGGHSDSSSSFVILLGYIEEQCSGVNHLSESTRQSLRSTWGYDCSAHGACRVVPLPASPPSPPSPPFAAPLMCKSGFCSSIGNDCCAPFNEEATCTHGHVAVRLPGGCYDFDHGAYVCCASVSSLPPPPPSPPPPPPPSPHPPPPPSPPPPPPPSPHPPPSPSPTPPPSPPPSPHSPPPSPPPRPLPQPPSRPPVLRPPPSQQPPLSPLPRPPPSPSPSASLLDLHSPTSSPLSLAPSAEASAISHVDAATPDMSKLLFLFCMVAMSISSVLCCIVWCYFFLKRKARGRDTTRSTRATKIADGVQLDEQPVDNGEEEVGGLECGRKQRWWKDRASTKHKKLDAVEDEAK